MIVIVAAALKIPKIYFKKLRGLSVREYEIGGSPATVYTDVPRRGTIGSHSREWMTSYTIPLHNGMGYMWPPPNTTTWCVNDLKKIIKWSGELIKNFIWLWTCYYLFFLRTNSQRRPGQRGWTYSRTVSMHTVTVSWVERGGGILRISYAELEMPWHCTRGTPRGNGLWPLNYTPKRFLTDDIRASAIHHL